MTSGIHSGFLADTAFNLLEGAQGGLWLVDLWHR
jgi:hypothetical protein